LIREGAAVPEKQQEKLLELVGSLSAEQQRAVEAFIRYLHEKGASEIRLDVRTALDEFIVEHSELLRRLAR
jgi:hypothetical protein